METCTSPTLPRTVETPSGERLLLREMTPDDRDAVLDLYQRLDPEDTYRRFFTGTRPPVDYFDRLAHIADRGGCSIVALDVADPTAVDPPIVAEANVERLPNGNGEIAVTVDRSWRGWLGAFMLSVLRDRAAAIGIANLEAQILTCNRPMRALTRRSGEAVIPEGDWQTVHVVFASSGTAPSWPPIAESSTGRKVLVEVAAMSVNAFADLLAGGDDVMVCCGRRPGAPPCPMLMGDGDCALASGADVIVVALADEVQRQRLLDAHERHHPDVPVVAVDVSAGRAATAAELAAAARRRSPGES